MKDEREHFNLDPEASWKKAEPLLDRHFARKRWTLLLLWVLLTGTVSLVAYLLWRPESAPPQTVLQTAGQADSRVASTQPSTTAATEREAPSGSIAAVQPAAPGSTQPATATRRQDIPVASASPLNPTGRSEVLASHSGRRASTTPASPRPNITTETTRPTPQSDPAAMDYGSPIMRQETETTLDAFDFLALHPFAAFDLSAAGSYAPETRLVQTLPARTDLSWHLTATAGGFQVFKQVESSLQGWDEVRNGREQEILTAAYGLSFGFGRRSWDLTIGAEWTQYGEENAYVPRSYQDRYIDDSHWQSYTYWTVDTDTAYIMGNPWLMNSDVQMADSNWVVDYDTLSQLGYDASIDAARGRTSIRYIELPLEFTWRLTQGRWGFGLTAGLAPAWFTASRGRYIARTLTGTESIRELGELRAFLLNARAGLDVEYRMHPRFTLLLRPQYRTQLSSIFNDASGIDQRYQAVGVQAGVRYRFR